MVECSPATRAARVRFPADANFLNVFLFHVCCKFQNWPFKEHWLLYVPPGLTHNNSMFCPHSVFMCFVWIWEQTAIMSLYNINWLVCITETECVYCAVRTGSLYIIQVMCFVWIWEQTAIMSLCSINWLVCIAGRESVHCAVRTGSLYIIQVMFFVWIWEQRAIISLYSINWLVCITQTECLLRGTDWVPIYRVSQKERT